MSLRSAAVCLCAAFLLGLAAPALASGSSTANEPVRVDSSTSVSRTFESPTVAVDPTDQRRVYVAYSDLQNNTCHIALTEGGGAFTELPAPDFGSYTDCGLVKNPNLPANIRMGLQVDPEGVVYWALSVADPSPQYHGGRSVALAISRDQGQSWSTQILAKAPATRDPDQAVTNFVPSLFVDPFGDAPRTVIVSWRRSYTYSVPKATEGWARISRDGGKTFGAEVRGTDANPGFAAPSIVMDDTGAIYWFQRQRPPEPAKGEKPQPNVLLWAKSTDGGKTWTQGDVGVSQAVMEEPVAAVSPDGRAIYVVWADDRSGKDLDIFFKETTDGARTWSSDVRLNDDSPGDRKAQKWPRMSVAPDGRIDVAWYDYRNDAGLVPKDDIEFYLGKTNDVYATYSTDGGQTFAPNVRVTDRSIDRSIGTYNEQYFVEVPPGVGSADGYAAFAWSDTRLGNSQNSLQDVFATTVSVSSGGGRVLGVSTRTFVLVVELVAVGLGLVLLLAALVLRARSRPPVAPA